MKTTMLYATGLGLMLAATGCPSEVEGPPDATTPTDAFVLIGTDAPPIDTGTANDVTTPPSDTNTVDAFMGGGDCSLSGYPALSLVNIATGATPWTRPVHVAQPVGTTDLYVVDQRGLIYLVRGGVVEATPFLDIRTTIGMLGGIGDEQGLLSIAFHPAYATNGRFFLGYTSKIRPTPSTLAPNVIAEGARSAGNPLVANATLSIPDFASNHNGGSLVFGPDGFLYIGAGDGGGGGDPMDTAQNPNNLLGKMLRIDVDAAGLPYGIPTTNPFATTAGFRPEIWAIGYRNPWRFSFDRMTREMYVADVGQDAREEVDIEMPSGGGRNYGWSARFAQATRIRLLCSMFSTAAERPSFATHARSRAGSCTAAPLFPRCVAHTFSATTAAPMSRPSATVTAQCASRCVSTWVVASTPSSRLARTTWANSTS